MSVKVFESHTKLDSEFCDVFDRACARVGIDAFRSEYEHIKPPAWRTIKGELRQSQALFLLIGKALIEAQTKHKIEWEYTQNWIAYEIGAASQLGIDVWVLCDNLQINFPVPYFNHYMPYSIRDNQFDSLVMVLQMYADKMASVVKGLPGKLTCVYPDCSITYNLHGYVPKNGIVVCPCCLRQMKFPNGRDVYDWPIAIEKSS